MTELDTVAPAGPSRRTVLKTAAWSAPVVAMTVATPLAAATGTVTGNLRIALGSSGIYHYYEPLSFDEAFEGTVGALYDANPGDGAAPVGTIDRDTYDQWNLAVDNYSIDAANYLGQGQTIVSPYVYLDRTLSTVNRTGGGTVPAGTVVTAQFTAPGFRVTGTTTPGAGGFVGVPTIAGSTLVVTNTLSTNAGSGASVLGNIALDAVIDATTVTVTFGDYGNVSSTLTGAIVAPGDSNASDNTATGSVSFYTNPLWVLNNVINNLQGIANSHATVVDNPDWYGYPTNNATPIDRAALDSIVIFTGPLTQTS